MSLNNSKILLKNANFDSKLKISTQNGMEMVSKLKNSYRNKNFSSKRKIFIQNFKFLIEIEDFHSKLKISWQNGKFSN